MPHPARSKVASTKLRVEPLPAEELDKSKVHAASMATQRAKKGRPPGKKAAEKTAPIAKEAVPATTTARPRGRLAAKKVIADEGQKSALDALRARRDAALKGKDAKQSPVAQAATSTTIIQKTMHTAVQTSSTPTQTTAKRVTPRSKQGKATADSARQDRTPPAQPGTDDDLYGLSPEGEASKKRIKRRESTQQRPPHSALKAHGTPAVETSILALANFKRRPRQPSIIRMVQQTSELGNQSDFDATLDETLGDFDNFNPDDESTPLHLNKRKSGGLSASKSHRDSLQSMSSSRKRKHSDEEEVIQVPRSPALASSPPPSVDRSLSDPRSISSSSLLEQVIPSTEREAGHQLEAEIYSDTMAPPRSSSEFSSPFQVASTASRPDKRRKTTAKTRGAVEAQPPSRRNAREKKVLALSTAALQSLLPKAPQRKRKAAKVDPYDIPSSDPTEPSILEDSDDGDELAQPTTRRGTIAATRTPIRKIDGNRGKKTETGRKSVKAPTPKAKQQRTYGRARPAESEKENDDTIEISDDASDSSGDEAGVRSKKQRDSGVGMAASKELQEVRKKFAEVDEWEMEFESVDLGGGATSSPYR